MEVVAQPKLKPRTPASQQVALPSIAAPPPMLPQLLDFDSPPTSMMPGQQGQRDSNTPAVPTSPVSILASQQISFRAIGCAAKDSATLPIPLRMIHAKDGKSLPSLTRTTKLFTLNVKLMKLSLFTMNIYVTTDATGVRCVLGQPRTTYL